MGRMSEPPAITGLQLQQDPFVAPVRVCVIGARRVRNGTGPFFARQAADLGAELVAVLGTTDTTAERARSDLAADGYTCPAYSDFDAMVNECRPEALVVASPAGTHRPWLEAALQHEMHVLCEKPLLSTYDQASFLVPHRFAAQGRVLMENCQWPMTLEAFGRLHPDCALDQVSRFRMMLAPAFRGLSRWLEIVSHPLSLLQAVAPGPAELENVRFQEAALDAPDSRLFFCFQSLQRSIECEILLQDTGERPRPAEYAFDDLVCRRRVENPGYQFFFDKGYRPDGQPQSERVDAEDPQVQALQRFLTAVNRARKNGMAGVDEALARRQRLVQQVLASYSAHCA